jgi:CubicO group peptidase (beta-lactamase class C family)
MKRHFSLFVSCFLLLATSCKMGRLIIYNFSDIKDYRIFPARELKASPNPFMFYAKTKQHMPDSLLHKGKKVNLTKFLEDESTLAFLVIRNDTILYETYFRDKDKNLIVPSFSMAKSFTSALIGCAIEDGLIKSVDEPVTNYIPELKENGFDKVKIKHVLQMTTGLKFNENYINPFSDVGAFYYGLHLRKNVLKLKLAYEPGTKFEYISGNTEVLGLVLERALKNKTITQYLQEKIWTPLQMEFDASWSIDQKKDGIEKTFCCINARARDFAKFGKLFLNKGNYNGTQVVPASWVEQCTKADLTEGGAPDYKYQWWLEKDGSYQAQGYLGQHIYICPKKNIVIVKLSKWRNQKLNWAGYFKQITDQL